MAKKPEAPKKRSRSKMETGTASKASGGKSYQISGGVHVGRDAVFGDQSNVYYQTANIQTPSEFLVELQKLQAQLAALKQQTVITAEQVQSIEKAESQVNEAITEIKKPKPIGKRIEDTLTSAKKTIDSLSGGLKSAVGLGIALAGLIQLVSNLFK